MIKEPHVRFYVGAPLKLPSGQNIGTLCMIDSVPREIDAIGLAILSSLRDLVVEELSNQASSSDERHGI